MGPYSGRDIALFVICLFFPPLPVLVKTGCSVDLLINLCLCALGAIPGIIHGFYIVHKYNDSVSDLEADANGYQQIVVEDEASSLYGATH